MGAPLCDPAGLQVNDLVRISYGGDPVGHDNAADTGDALQGLLDLGLRFHIQSGC